MDPIRLQTSTLVTVGPQRGEETEAQKREGPWPTVSLRQSWGQNTEVLEQNFRREAGRGDWQGVSAGTLTP